MANEKKMTEAKREFEKMECAAEVGKTLPKKAKREFEKMECAAEVGKTLPKKAEG